MRELKVFIELMGTQTFAGRIYGENHKDAVFVYDGSYLDLTDAAPISISLPLGREPFSVEETRNFFESLLPEGFSRRSVANWLKADENDCLTILSALGRECLGAILRWQHQT